MPGILLHTVGNSEDKLSKCFKLARNEVGAMLLLGYGGGGGGSFVGRGTIKGSIIPDEPRRKSRKPLTYSVMEVNIFARVRLCLCYQYKPQIVYSSNLLSVASILAVLKKEAGYY
ncbi:hypothetical protein D5086_021705 [Populus alba]|uniref:Uncharacterized protein n=1 Tax=Populus alba TaxID=43335 RepID=A0ACC4BDJ9_POPAL